MAIKKSSLEGKWYYRVARVFFLILPIIILLFLLLSNKKVNVCKIPQYSMPDFLQQYLLYILIGLVLYYLVIKGVWRIILYVVFGGLENDTKKEEKIVQNNTPTPGKGKADNIIKIISILIILGALAVLLLSKMGYLTPNGININTNPPKHTCWATSAEMGTPCHSGSGGVAVLGVITYDYCNCPSDTTYAGMDNITAGGPYKICTCK